MFLTLSAFNETNEIKDQQTDASRMNELADALTNISKRIETMEVSVPENSVCQFLFFGVSALTHNFLVCQH